MKRPPALTKKKLPMVLPPITPHSSLQNKPKLRSSNQDLKSAPCLKIYSTQISVQKQRRQTIKRIIQQHYSNYEKERIKSPLIIESALPYQNKQKGIKNQSSKNTIRLKVKNKQKRLKRLFIRYQDQQQFHFSILRKNKAQESILRSARCKTQETDEVDASLSRHCLYNFFRGRINPSDFGNKKIEIQKNKIILKPKQTQNRPIEQATKIEKVKSQPKPTTAIFDKPSIKKTLREISLSGWWTKSEEDNIQ